jgi:hypothetical protein
MPQPRFLDLERLFRAAGTRALYSRPEARRYDRSPTRPLRNLRLAFLATALTAALLSLGAIVLPPEATAVTVWTGPLTSFTKAAAADPTLPANQDRITSNVWITRGSSQGIYNAKTETFFVHSLSPADTEWANGTTANFSTLSYTDWNTWAKSVNGGPPSTVSVKAVMHLKSDDIYLDVMFTSWSIDAGGSFSYTRSTPAPGNSPPSVTITNPINGAAFTAPATFTIQADASDQDGEISNVQFFRDTASLGVVSAFPYSFTVTNLAAGSYTLTAVAADDLNATATNRVAITVTNPPPPSATILNPALNGNSFTFSCNTQTGHLYSVQFTPALKQPNWSVLTNFNGTGSQVQVTDSNLTNAQFYRVEIH